MTKLPFLRVVAATTFLVAGAVMFHLGADPIITTGLFVSAAALVGVPMLLTSTGKKMVGPLLLLGALASCATVDELAEKAKLPVVDSAFYSGAVVASFVEAIAAGDSDKDGVISGTNEWTRTLTLFATHLYQRILERTE